MKLEKFRKIKKQKRIIIGSIVGLILFVGGITLYKTFAFYEEKKEFNVLKGRVPEFVRNDIELAMTLNGETIEKTVPKGDYLVFVNCDKEAIASWNYEEWQFVVKDFEKGVKCSIDFKTKTLANYIKYIAKNNDELVYDETEDKSLRYVGLEPNNYVLFNGELWRIIGVINNIKKDENSISEERVKLVREEPLDNIKYDYAKDLTYTSKLWKDLSISEILNAYYNSTIWSDGKDNTLDFTSNGIKEEARKYIDYASWQVGTTPFSSVPSEVYQKEKNAIYYGIIGLPSQSDVTYSIKGNSVNSRNICQNYSGGLYELRNLEGCSSTSWMYKEASAMQNVSRLYHNSPISSLMDGNTLYVNHISKIYPTIMLKSHVLFSQGEGTKANPFYVAIDN